MCVNAGSSDDDLGMALARLSEAIVCPQDLLGWACPLAWVTFDLCHTPTTLTPAHQLTSLRTQVRMSGWRRCEGLVIVWSCPPTQELGCAIVLGCVIVDAVEAVL